MSNIFRSCHYQDPSDEIPSGWSKKDCPMFNLKFPVQTSWKTSKRKMLIIVGHVDAEDLKSKRLLSSLNGEILSNVLQYSRQWAQPHLKENNTWSYAAFNFNFFKTYHLDTARQKAAASVNVARAKQWIKKLNPTHIVVIGDPAAEALLSDVANVQNKHGWVHTLKIGDKKYPTVTTISMDKTYVLNSDDFDEEDDDVDVGTSDDAAMDNVNLLGYISRNIASSYIGFMPYDVSHVKANPVLIDTMTKFDKLLHLLNTRSVIAYDTETKNLNRVANSVLLMQFSFDENRGFILPINHKDTPFNGKQLMTMKSGLRDFFRKPVPYAAKPKTYLIGQNIKFDLTVTRQELGIPIIHYPVWDTMAGESSLDENLKALSNYGIPSGGLAQIMSHHGNDFYFTNPFSKADRSNMESVDLHAPGFLDYCSMDTQGVFAIHNQQIRRAFNEPYDKQNKYANVQVKPETFETYGVPYQRFMLNQMSNNIHMFSHMEHRGVAMDVPFMLSLLAKDSPFNKIVKEEEAKLFAMPNVKKANALLLKREKVPTTSMFGEVNKWIFKLSKPAHKQALFFDILELKPLSYGKQVDEDGNKLGKLDVWFQKAYKDIPEVAQLTRISKLQKLKSSYIESFYRKMEQSDDGRLDHRLRPSYDFYKVVTGRSNSSDPSLQQIPQRTVEAKYIKRMFCAPKGRLKVKFDYSAHEVRGWSIISGDKPLAEAFHVARNLKAKLYQLSLKYLAKPLDKVKKAMEVVVADLKKKGDIHIFNVHFFFNKWVEKSDPLRDAIKAIVFGVIYGKGANALAKDIGQTKKYAVNLIDKLFNRFKKGKEWLDWCKEFSAKNLFIYSPIGRKRNLFGYLTGIGMLVAAMERRSQNSPIQGMAADFGHTAARLFDQEWEKVLLKLKYMTLEDTKLPSEIEVMVHDAVYGETPYHLVLIQFQVLQYCAVTGVEKFYNEVFNYKFTVPLEIEFEFGCSDDRMYKHDWTQENLKQCVISALKDQVSDGKLSKDEAKDAYKSMYSEWNKHKEYLDKHYPFFKGADIESV